MTATPLLRPLSRLLHEHPDERPAGEPFLATVRQEPVIVQAVLERTCVVEREFDGERAVVPHTEVYVRPQEIRWVRPTRNRQGSWHNPLQREGGAR